MTTKSNFWRRFCRNKGAVFGLVVLVIVAMMAIVGPALAPNDPWSMVDQPFLAPLSDHALPMGTDTLGRDIFSGVIDGARISLLIGVVSTIAAMFIGVTLGALSG